MNEKKKRYKKRLDIQHKMISRQSEQIELLKSQNESLNLKLEEKDKLINSISPLREELTQNVADVKKYKEEYKELIQELKKMKSIVDQEVYRGRWKIVRWLIK